MIKLNTEKQITTNLSVLCFIAMKHGLSEINE